MSDRRAFLKVIAALAASMASPIASRAVENARTDILLNNVSNYFNICNTGSIGSIGPIGSCYATISNRR